MDAYGTLLLSSRSMASIDIWPEQNQNHWQWAKLLDAGKEDSICFAYQRDRIAVAFPRIGVKVWIWIKGKVICVNARYLH